MTDDDLDDVPGEEQPATDATRSRRRRRAHLDPGPRMRRGTWTGETAPPPLRGTGSAERFDVALRTLSDEGASPEDADTARLLAAAPVVGMGRIAYSSNATFVVELDAADPTASSRPLRAVYKPARGERPLWDFPHGTLHFRETATYLVDAALGFGLVPATVLRDGPLGPGSMQHLVHTAQPPLTHAQRAAVEAGLFAMAALDVLVNNADRKSSHLLVTESHGLRGIDHGLTFLPYPRQRTVLIELGGQPLPEAVAASVRSLCDDGERRAALLRRLRLLLDAEEVDAFDARLVELSADPVYPVLDPWDGRPFEWW